MRQRHAGFTLVEVLVGTTIFAMMLALLTSALFSMTRSVRSGEARLTEVDDARLVRTFLRRQLSQAFPLTERVEEEQRALFAGLPDELRFVGHLPAHRGGGGLQFLELRTSLRAAERHRAGARAARSERAEPDSRDFVLNYRNAWPDVPFDTHVDDTVWDGEVLVEDVRRVRYRYFGNADDESVAEWRHTWTGADRLPMLIELKIEMSDGRGWPPIVAAVRSRSAIAQAQLFRPGENGAP